MSARQVPAPDDVVQRGVRGPSPQGTATFIGLRALDLPLQYAILKHGLGNGLINRLGGTVLPPGAAALTNTPLDALGLSPYRLILFLMATGSFVKQSYWVSALSFERIVPKLSVLVSAFNSVCNGINNLLFLNRATSASMSGQGFPQAPLLVGSALYVAGMLIETGSEQQRCLFKKDPNNKGKVYSGGLFGAARHINYFGYTLWRCGYAMAAGGYTWGLVVAAFCSVDFNVRAIPELNSYCEDRYGEQWQDYKRKTPFQFIPGIY